MTTSDTHTAGRSIPRTWFFSVLALVCIITTVIILINRIVDVYGVCRTDFTKQIQEPNKNYIKIRYLMRNPDRFDSYLFGSSRVNIFDGRRIRGGVYYNMTYSEGLPKDHLDNIKFMLSRGMRIKNIIIGLDEFSSMVDPRQHLYDLLRQPCPEVSGKNPVLVFLEYYMKLTRFFARFREYLRVHYLWKSNGTPLRFTYDIYDTGRTLCATCDDDIEKDIEKHIHDSKFDKPNHYEGDNLKGSIENLREIADLARTNDIRLILFINPIHKTTYLDTDQEHFLAFKRELAKITDYYDFSGLNSITTNNYYYYETSHYRPMVADMILQRLIGSPNVPVPADFGVLVTKQNIDAHLNELRQQVSRWRAQHPVMNDPKRSSRGEHD